MSVDFTFTGIDITDILISSSKIDDPRERNRVFYDKFEERMNGRRFSDKELEYLYGVLSGINYGRKLHD